MERLEIEVVPEVATTAIDTVIAAQATPFKDELNADVEGEAVVNADKVEAGQADADGPGEDALLCPICLNVPALEELAVIKGCEHAYCVKCIMQWTTHREKACCPQCKVGFSYLLTYRSLDGTLHDYPVEESVCLLKRAVWFEEHMRAVEKGKAVILPHPPALAESESMYDDYLRFYDEYDEDQEVEDFYFSSAAGRARVVIGNRRFGDGGYMSSGRRNARPVVPAKCKTPGKGKAPVTPPSATVYTASHKQHCASSGGGSSSNPTSVSADKGKGKAGRRARRKMRQDTVDADYDD